MFYLNSLLSYQDKLYIYHQLLDYMSSLDITHILISQKMVNNLQDITYNMNYHQNLHNHQDIFHKNWPLQKLFQKIRSVVLMTFESCSES